MKSMEDRGYEAISRSIDEYANLLRIINSPDPKKEAENQKRVLKAKLQAFGVVTEKLEID